MTARTFLKTATLSMSSAALLAMLGHASLAAQTVELRWKFGAGAEHLYRQVQRTQSSGGMGDVAQTQESTLRQAVVSVAGDGAADVRVTYESIRMVQDGPMGRQEYDSRSGQPATEPMSMMLSKMVGVNFEMTIGRDGVVRRVSGIERMIDAMMSGLDGQMAAMMRPMLEGMFSEESMRSMMQQSVHSLPETPVAAGATWSRTTSLTFPFGTMNTDYRYTLKEIAVEQGRRIARIDVRGTIGKLEPNPANPMSASIQMSDGEMSGTLDFDVDQGLLVRSTFTTDMNMSAMGQAMRTNSTVEFALVESTARRRP